MKEKINYMVSIEKNSLTISKDQREKDEVNITQDKKHCFLKVPKPELSPFDPEYHAKLKEQRSKEVSDHLVKRMFLERVLHTLEHKSCLNHGEHLFSYIGREFKTLASYNYQVGVETSLLQFLKNEEFS